MAADPGHPLPSTEKRFPIALSCQTPATAGALHKGDVRPLHNPNTIHDRPRPCTLHQLPCYCTVTSIYSSACAATSIAPHPLLDTSMAHGLHGQRSPQRSEAHTEHAAHAVPPASSCERRTRRVSPRSRPLRVRERAGPGPGSPSRALRYSSPRLSRGPWPRSAGRASPAPSAQPRAAPVPRGQAAGAEAAARRGRADGGGCGAARTHLPVCSGGCRGKEAAGSGGVGHRLTRKGWREAACPLPQAQGCVPIPVPILPGRAKP